MVKSLNQSLRRHIRIHATPFVLPSCDFGFKLILRDSHVTAVIAEYISNDLTSIFLISVDGKYVLFCSHTSWHSNLSFKNTCRAGEANLMRKNFFSDLSCTHGRTCVYGRYAPGKLQNGLETKISRTFLDFLHLGHEFFVISGHGT